jgi:hypothetical protein
MSYKKENIVKGGARIIFGGQPVGYTRDAVSLILNDDKIVLDDIQQVMGVVDVSRTKASVQIKANLYEFTLDNLRAAWGISSGVNVSAAVKSLNLIMGDYIEGELVVYGKGESNVLRTYLFYKAKLIEVGEINIDAFGYTVIPVTFQVLVHPNYTELGKVSQEYTPSSVVTE